MDLKQYFKKIKDTEASIQDEYPLIVSLETSDGGKPGALVEVSRAQAAKAIAENRAVLATDEQKTAYYVQEALRRKTIEKAELSRRLQIAIISDSELRTAASQLEAEDEPRGSR
jgi:hypothetical protein